MKRLSLVEVDLSDVTSSDALHSLLSHALGFPGWYGCNWDAFWDAITALVPMPLQLKLLGWESFSRRLPNDARLLKECLDDMQAQYPEDASDVEFG
ncbi:Barstar, RNAse (barnase) inhibitor [Pseudomonas asplenii]|uniref:Barstar, RNAse (Barnase) inhibitor n=1 Tax=Pseudomonas asplenii TaxID=53407 RepID=A0A0N0E1L9_9PSED|nr:barstar family protein [Pseudomonas fuscovaginae]KPA87850.1 Barstar, RNAse (barnase) inhibitor [Pseudomonas fuscovaginae]